MLGCQSRVSEEAKAVNYRLTVLEVSTTIDYGSPNKTNNTDVQGAAYGADEATISR